MTEYTEREAAIAEAEAVAGSLRRAGFMASTIVVFGGLGAIGAALVLQQGLWLLVALINFVTAFWVHAVSTAIAHLVKPRP